MDKITAFCKRQLKSVNFWLSAVSVILTLVGIILISVSSSVQGYSISELAIIVVCGVFAMICMLGGIWLSDRFGPHHWSTFVANLVSIVLLSFCFANVIMARAVLTSSQFSFDAVNTVGWTVLYESFVSLGMFLVSAILLVVSGYNGKEKEEKAAE